MSETKKVTIKWYWFDKDNYKNGDKNGWKLVPTEENLTLEQEYQIHLANRSSGIVYHCFGNGYSALASFNTMMTCCGSARCMIGHHGKDVKNDHMEYQLKRLVG